MSSTLPKQKKSANSPKNSADKLGPKNLMKLSLSFPPRPGWATKPNIFPKSPESVAAATKLPQAAEATKAF